MGSTSIISVELSTPNGTHECVCVWISMFGRVRRRRETLFGVDLYKNFGVSSVLELLGERNDVRKMCSVCNM